MWTRIKSLNLNTNKVVTYTLLGLFSLAVIVWLFGVDYVVEWIDWTGDIIDEQIRSVPSEDGTE